MLPALRSTLWANSFGRIGPRWYSASRAPNWPMVTDPSAKRSSARAGVPTAERVAVPGGAPMAEWVDGRAGVWAQRIPPPARPRPPRDRYPSAERDPDAPPRRRPSSGAGWIIALAVGIPLLLLLL